MAQSDGKKFLYQQVCQSIKNKILSVEYPYGSLLPSEREIGELFQVDRTTVRKALQVLVDEGYAEKRAGKGTVVIWQADPVSPATVATKPTTAGETERKAIAFFLPKSRQNSNRITQPFYSQLFYTIQKECQDYGYSLIYSTLEETDDFDEIIRLNDYSGIFFVSNVAKAHLDRAQELGIPAVLINSYDEKLPSILSDNFNGTYISCRYLIEKGHRDFCILNGIKDYVSNQERFRGCETALKEAGLSVAKPYNLGGESWEFEAGMAEMQKLIDADVPLPTAVIAFNDRLAIGAMQALQQAGIRVPEEISIIGYDNSEQAKYAIPKLTTVEINAPLMAKTAAVFLFQLIEQYFDCPVKITTPTALVERDSVCEEK